ncbi:MAG: CHAD domain-containing protein [Chloroflexota bacterium]
MMKISHAERIDTLTDKPVSPVQPEAPIADALRTVARQQFIDLLKKEIETHHERNVLSISQLATATHALSNSVKLLAPYLSDKSAARFEKRLAKLARRVEGVRMLDAIVRDLLVLGEASTDRRTISSLIARLDAQRLVGKQKLYTYLSSKKYRKFLDQFQLMLTQPLDDVVEADETARPYRLGHVRPVLLMQHLAWVRHCGTAKDALTAEDCTRLYHHLNTVRNIVDDLCVQQDTTPEFIGQSQPLFDKLDDVVQITDRLTFLIHLPRINLENEQITVMRTYRDDLRARRETAIADIPALWQAFNRPPIYAQLAAAAISPNVDLTLQ